VGNKIYYCFSNCLGCSWKIRGFVLPTDPPEEIEPTALAAFGIGLLNALHFIS